MKGHKKLLFFNKQFGTTLAFVFMLPALKDATAKTFFIQYNI